MEYIYPYKTCWYNNISWFYLFFKNTSVLTWNNLAWEGLVCHTDYYLYQTVSWTELCQLDLLERGYLTLLRIVSYYHRITGWKCRNNLTNYCLPGKDYKNGEFWVSGYDLGRSGHYVWMTTGEPLKDIVLDAGLPNNIEKHCIRMVKNETALFYSNYPCQAMFFYICESQEDNVDIRK